MQFLKSKHRESVFKCVDKTLHDEHICHFEFIITVLTDMVMQNIAGKTLQPVVATEDNRRTEDIYS